MERDAGAAAVCLPVAALFSLPLLLEYAPLAAGNMGKQGWIRDTAALVGRAAPKAAALHLAAGVLA